MRLNPEKTRDLFRRLERTDMRGLRDRMLDAIQRARYISSENDGYPRSASGADHGAGGTAESTSVEAAALNRLERASYVDHVVAAFVALDRAVGDLDTIDSQLKHAAKLVDPTQTQKVRRCWCCWRHGLDTPYDHTCDPGKNLGKEIDVCHACLMQIRRTGEPCDRAVHLRRQEAQAS